MECDFGKLTKAYKEDLKFLVDQEDYELWVKGNSFRLDTNKDGKHKSVQFSNRNGGLHSKLLHRLIMDAGPNDIIDHKNGNVLDNRKSNLRFATISENNQNRQLTKKNSSGIKGVSWHKQNKKWVAYINIDGKRINLGCYENLDDAEDVVRKARIELHREFARFS
jgi:hypothetical protein